MKILFDARLVGVQHGGIGRYSHELLRELFKIDKKNEYILVCNQDGKEILQSLVGQYAKHRIELVKTRHYSLKEQLYLHKRLNKFSADLAHFPNFNAPFFYDRPYVATIHDLAHHKLSGHKKSTYAHFLAYKKVIENTAKKAKRIITVSETSKADIVKFLSVPPAKVSVVYEGSNLNPDVSQNRVEEVKKRFLLSRPYFLFVGVLERKKNLINLSRGFDLFLEKYRYDFDLVIAGKADSHYPDIRYKILDIRNKNRIVLTGEISDNELSALYRGAYAFVTASEFEGFGLPGVEAMKFGLPLAVSNTKVFNEIYDNAAVYFDQKNPEDIADKLNLLARDSEFKEKLRSFSWQRSGYFNWEHTATQTLEIYESLI